jgi:hypothetical protein
MICHSNTIAACHNDVVAVFEPIQQALQELDLLFDVTFVGTRLIGLKPPKLLQAAKLDDELVRRYLERRIRQLMPTWAQFHTVLCTDHVTYSTFDVILKQDVERFAYACQQLLDKTGFSPAFVNSESGHQPIPSLLKRIETAADFYSLRT